MAKGGFNIMRYGAGPNGPMRTLGQYMLGSGATFGYALAVYDHDVLQIYDPYRT